MSDNKKNEDNARRPAGHDELAEQRRRDEEDSNTLVEEGLLNRIVGPLVVVPESAYRRRNPPRLEGLLDYSRGIRQGITRVAADVRISQVARSRVEEYAESIRQGDTTMPDDLRQMAEREMPRELAEVEHRMSNTRIPEGSMGNDASASQAAATGHVSRAQGTAPRQPTLSEGDQEKLYTEEQVRMNVRTATAGVLRLVQRRHEGVITDDEFRSIVRETTGVDVPVMFIPVSTPPAFRAEEEDRPGQDAVAPRPRNEDEGEWWE